MTTPPAKHQKFLAVQTKLDMPMLFLSFVWLGILITDLVIGELPILSTVGTIIWVLFIFYFGLRFVNAADRRLFLKKNWLFVVAILVSVLRFFPFLQTIAVVRAVTATFGMQVIWIFTSAEQGMRSLRRKLGRRGSGYALAFTVVVIFAGAAGLLHFEEISDDPQRLQDYPRALWWTAMQMTNIGSAYSMKTTGGRIVSLGISVYAAAMFGYLTALFATLLIDRDAKDPKSEIPSQKTIRDVQDEIKQMRLLLENYLNNESKKNK